MRIEAIKAARTKNTADINDTVIEIDQEFAGIMNNPIFPLTGSRLTSALQRRRNNDDTIG